MISELPIIFTLKFVDHLVVLVLAELPRQVIFVRFKGSVGGNKLGQSQSPVEKHRNEPHGLENILQSYLLAAIPQESIIKQIKLIKKAEVRFVHKLLNLLIVCLSDEDLNNEIQYRGHQLKTVEVWVIPVKTCVDYNASLLVYHNRVHVILPEEGGVCLQLPAGIRGVLLQVAVPAVHQHIHAVVDSHWIEPEVQT